MKVHYYIYLIIAGILLLSGCNNSSLREREYAEYQQFTNEIMTGLLPYFPYASNDTMLVFENESGTHKDTLSFFKNERGSNVAQTVSISEYEPLYPGDYVGLFFHLRLVTIFHSVETKITQDVIVSNRAQLSKDSTGTIHWGGRLYYIEDASKGEQLYEQSEYINLNRLNSYLKDSIALKPIDENPFSGYMIYVRHKGLVEYSFDGQEIWRLVEE